MEIKSYGKSELALMYRPGLTKSSAWKTLRNWIHRNPSLSRTLKRLGYKSRDKIFTAEMVRAIARHLGEP